MKKSSHEKSTKIIGLICIIAIFASLACQFMSCWSYSGIITDENTGEERAKNLKMSLASYIWFPYTQEADAFTDYLKDPTLNYAETVVTVDEYSKEELDEIEAKLNGQEEEEVTEEATTEEATTEEAVTEEAATEEATTEEVATEEATTEEVATEEATTEETAVDSDSEFTYFATLVEIEEFHKDVTDKSYYKTVLSSAKDSDKTVKRYNEFSKELDEDYSKAINGLITLPVFLLIASIISIILIILSMRKGGSNNYVASICTLIIGAVNIIHLLIRPIFLLCLNSSYNTMLMIFIITTLLGLIFLYKDIKASVKAKAASK